MGRRGRRGLSRPAQRGAPDLSLLHPELERPLGAAACCAAPGFTAPLDADAMHAAAQALHRRARLLGVPLGRMPVEVDAGAGSSGSRCSATAIGCGWRSRRMPICTTWCATSSERCWTRSARRDPAGTMRRILESRDRRLAGADRPRRGPVSLAGGVSAAVRDSCTPCALFAKLSRITHEQSHRPG